MKKATALTTTLFVLLAAGLTAQETNNIEKATPTFVSLRLDFATLLGGKAEDRAHGMAVDAQGNVYLTAPVHSTDFPTTPNAINRTPTSVYLAKLSAGGVLLYSTFLGAPGGANYAHGVAVDKYGCIYIAGNTANPNFPTTHGAFQTTFKGPSNAPHGDAFVMKLSPAGDRIIYSTFLGGSGMDNCGKIAVDTEGNAYVLGSTSSKDFPVTVGAFQPAFKGGGEGSYGELFVAKLNPDGSKLIYCTYLGGSGDDNGGNLVVDAGGCVYVACTTASPDFPTTANACQRPCGGKEDTVLVSLNPTGTALEYASYLGGSDRDVARSIALDRDGNVWLAGDTASTDFPTTPDAYCRQNKGGTDGFFARINPRDGKLLYSSLIGGSKAEAMMLALGRSGGVVLAGRTESADLPVTPRAADATLDGPSDLFVALFDPVAKTLRYCTLLGGSGIDNLSALVCQEGHLYLAGNTTSTDFPVTTGARFKGGTNLWGGDAFAIKFTLTDKGGASTREMK